MLDSYCCSQRSIDRDLYISHPLLQKGHQQVRLFVTLCYQNKEIGRLSGVCVEVGNLLQNGTIVAINLQKTCLHQIFNQTVDIKL